MIQLASDPNASRTWRPGQEEDKDASLQLRPGRSAHAWPFISRYTEKPAAPQQPQEPSSEHGS